MNWKQALELAQNTVITPEMEKQYQDDCDALLAELEDWPTLTEAQQTDWALTDEEVEQWEERGLKEAKEQLRFLSVNDVMAYEPTPMLVEDHIPSAGLGMIYGPSFTGKSFIAVSLAMAVATGKSKWLDLPLNIEEPKWVVYVGGEGGTPLAKQIQAWVLQHGGAENAKFLLLDFAKIDEPIIISPEETEIDWKYSLRRLWEEIDLGTNGEGAALIIIDTQISVVMAEENSNTEMSRALGQLKKYADRHNCLIINIHHAGWMKPSKNEIPRLRGASAQKGMLDLEIAVNSDGEGTGNIWYQKVKGGMRQGPYGYEIVGKRTPLGPSAYVTRSAEEDLMKIETPWSSPDAKKVLQAVEDGLTSALRISEVTGINRNRVGKLLGDLEGAEKVTKEGSGPTTKWLLHGSVQ